MNKVTLIEQSIDFDRVARASKASAWGMLIGGLLVAGSLVYGMVTIARVNSELDEKVRRMALVDKDLAETQLSLRQAQTQLGLAREQLASTAKEHTASAEKLEATKAELKQIEAKLVEAREKLELETAKFAATQTQLNQARDDNKALGRILTQAIPADELMSRAMEAEELVRLGVVPRASAERVSSAQPGEITRAGPSSGEGKQRYRFKLWLDFRDPGVRDQLVGTIEEVTYHFNHPTFAVPQASSTDPMSGYEVSYVGWGALRNVIVEIKLKNGSSVRKDFDMAAALPDVPTKENPRPAPAYKD
jgi:hypothetical protein